MTMAGEQALIPRAQIQPRSVGLGRSDESSVTWISISHSPRCISKIELTQASLTGWDCSRNNSKSHHFLSLATEADHFSYSTSKESTFLAGPMPYMTVLKIHIYSAKGSALSAFAAKWQSQASSTSKQPCPRGI